MIRPFGKSEHDPKDTNRWPGVNGTERIQNSAYGKVKGRTMVIFYFFTGFFRTLEFFDPKYG